MTLKDALRCGFSLLNVASLTAPKVGAQTRTMVVCLGGWGWDWKGSRIRMWGTLAVNRWIQDHWFRRPPLSFSWICIANCCSVTLGFFWSQKRLEGGIEMEEGQRWWWREGGSRVPTISRPSTLCNLTPLPNKKNPSPHSSFTSSCPGIPPQLPLPSPQTSPRYWVEHNRLIVLWVGGSDNSTAHRCIVCSNKPQRL